jgi:hypothetical protein
MRCRLRRADGRVAQWCSGCAWVADLFSHLGGR